MKHNSDSQTTHSVSLQKPTRSLQRTAVIQEPTSIQCIQHSLATHQPTNQPDNPNTSKVLLLRYKLIRHTTNTHTHTHTVQRVQLDNPTASHISHNSTQKQHPSLTHTRITNVPHSHLFSPISTRSVCCYWFLFIFRVP